jgi:glycosyltransferase involved in cell wall biosynthesis
VKSPGDAAGAPEVSVVVPTRDRADRLPVLLGALAGQTLARERYELIVVDDGSADGTADVLAAVGVDRVVRHERSRGPAAARNSGWRAARAPLVAFTDDDCRPEPGWLESGLRALQRAPGSIVQGVTRPEPADEPLLRSPHARSIRVDRLGPFFQTCNVFYPRAVLERVDGFDEGIPTPSSEDADLAMRALGAGARAVFAPDAVVNHAVVVRSTADAVRFSARWRTLPALVRRHPEIRRAFPWRGFVWRETHARLLLALAGLVLAPVHRAFLAWCVPYLTLRRGWRPQELRQAVVELPSVAVVDAAEVAVLAWASARERTLFL